MAAGVKHYFKDGTLYTGKTHKNPSGMVMSGAKHTKNSKQLFHKKDLSKAVQKKIK